MMRVARLGPMLALVIVSLGGVTLAATRTHRHAARPLVNRPAAPPSLSAAGITLASAILTLPDEKPVLPDSADGEMIGNKCTACHSGDMILNQPMLGADRWKAEIDKMRTVYHAQIAPEDDAAIVQALVGLQAPHR